MHFETKIKYYMYCNQPKITDYSCLSIKIYYTKKKSLSHILRVFVLIFYDLKLGTKWFKLN